VVDPAEGHPVPGEGFEEQLLLDPDAGAQDSDLHYSPQSSSSAGARRSVIGSCSITSSSAPQSGQGTISPFSMSPLSGTAASHSGQVADVAVDIWYHLRKQDISGARQGEDHRIVFDFISRRPPPGNPPPGRRRRSRWPRKSPGTRGCS